MVDSKIDGIKWAHDEVIASSAGGSPFLFCYGVTFFVTGILAFWLPRETSALIAMFQGGVALPTALRLERIMGRGKMSMDNPLRQLSNLMAVSQALAIPFLIVVYNVNPGQVPVCLAGLSGIHLLPYGWLHRTNVYLWLAVFVALASFAMVLLFKTASYELILILIGCAYLFTAPLLVLHSRKVTSPTQNTL